MQNYRYGASASCAVPHYVPELAGTRRIYPQMDGQAELTWWLVTISRPSTNQARRWLASLMRRPTDDATN